VHACHAGTETWTVAWQAIAMRDFEAERPPLPAAKWQLTSTPTEPGKSRQLNLARSAKRHNKASSQAIQHLWSQRRRRPECLLH
jgi:hypothetical protein